MVTIGGLELSVLQLIAAPLAFDCVAVHESQQFVVPSMQPEVRYQSEGKAIQFPSLLMVAMAFWALKFQEFIVAKVCPKR
jgi:hypothetical protein